MKEIGLIKNLLDQFDKSKYPKINKALKDLVSIHSIPTSSPFRILGCFSILELLLTTNKSGSENSLSHQLRTKITLLNNQSEHKILLEDYFKVPDTTTFESAIGLLYQYRNDIAHGNMPDFGKKLSTFKGQQQKILPFLQNVVRKVILFSVANPRLVSDLKEC